MKEKLRQIEKAFLNALSQVEDKDALKEIRVQFLGRKGEMKKVMKHMKDLAVEEKKEFGAFSNKVKSQIENKINEKLNELKTYEMNKKLEKEWVDITWPVSAAPGSVHPVTRVTRMVTEIFSSMGFEVLDGPEMESEENNFTKLNIPETHPARDTQDTFWLDNGKLLRTHTSPVQIRGMEKRKPPFKFIAPGKTYRNEAVDACHEHTFHQVEGMMVDKNVSISHMVYVLKKFVSRIFGSEVPVRLRPGYFPFVEPGFELDFKCRICGGKGCSVCKKTGWVEYLGCGMIHPEVLRNGNIDPDEYRGFAFGGGLERLLMMQYKIDDIRLFHSGDIRFLSQF
ncbi:MAG: phenylalanine--tRNA ligase subunit alpha [bacterium]